jgi:hypothetical protein
MYNENSPIFNCDDLISVGYIETPTEQATHKLYELLGELHHLQEYCSNNNLPFDAQSIDAIKSSILMMPKIRAA